jgi:hypothetical protein
METIAADKAPSSQETALAEESVEFTDGSTLIFGVVDFEAEDVEVIGVPNSGIENRNEVGPVAPASPTAVKRYGVLDLTFSEGLEVREGTKLLGRTPLKIKLTAGTHTLRFSDPARRLSLLREYTIGIGESVHDDTRLGKAHLAVDAPYGATVFLDSRPIGIAPIEEVTMVEGEHSVAIDYHGTTSLDTIVANDGETVHYRVSISDEDPPGSTPAHQ